MKRYLIDSMANYIFFVPLVIALTPPLWGEAAFQYLVAAVPISLVGARAYTLFLKRVWYPLWRISF